MIENEIHKTEIIEIINFYHLLVIKRPSAWKRIGEKEWKMKITGAEEFKEWKDQRLTSCILRSPGIKTGRILDSDSEPRSKFTEK